MSIGAKQNRELAERISAVALDLKASGEHRFIRPWRLDEDRARRETKELVSCSAGECGCGISPDVK
jgi:hypothetical protein